MDVINWLLDNADPSLEYQVYRDLAFPKSKTLKEYQDTIERFGFGKLLLSKRNANGHWGNNAYNPKWTCTHYVLFELLQLGLSPKNKACIESSELLLDHPIGTNGGINYAKTVEDSDVCINGMILNITSYFEVHSKKMEIIIEYLLNTQMEDGGWNCEYLHGATHSSLHTTLSVLEGISQYLHGSGAYRSNELEQAKNRGIEFILRHELYKKSTTGEIINDAFFKYSYPVRWKYDILRCLDYFQANHIPFDTRIKNALMKVDSSKDKNGIWKSHSQPGKTFYEIEQNGVKGKWNTLRALRVLKYFSKYL